MSENPGSRPAVFQSSRPLVFAHRGGAKLAPENTMPAFDNGMAFGVDGLELDVHLAADLVPVVIHDATLDRTTDRTGPVAALTSDELARVDAGYRFARDGSHPFRGTGAGVPTLEAVLRRFPDTRVIIEMKGASAALARAVVSVVRRVGAVERVCLSSFAQVTSDTVRAEAPEIATSASQEEARWTLHRSWIRWPWAGHRPYAAFQVPERVGRMRVVSPAFVRQAHREGQVVQVWVVDTPADISRLLGWGVDGLITDRPDVATDAVRRWVERQTQIPQMRDR